jgi:uncharacterized cupredoxin-like copper-binding protein
MINFFRGQSMKTRAVIGMVSALYFCSSPGIAQEAKTAGHSAHDHASMHRQQQAWGVEGEAKAAKRTLEITMLDSMRFTPEKIEVGQGETVRFVVKNAGQQKHEMVIGTRRSLDEHAALMLKFPGMEHDEPHMAHVDPGKTGELIWHFNRAGNFEFACLIAGHYQAGMRGSIRVARAAGKAK